MGLHDFIALAIIFVIVQVDASVATSKLLNGFPHLNTTSKAGVSATRYLTTSSGVNDNDEKRAGFSARIIENIKSKFSSSQGSEEQLQKWLKKSTSADTVFKKLDLTKAGDELFSNTQFAKWVQYVDDLNAQTRKEAVSAISKLTSEYGDDSLFRMIERAKKEPRTEKLASKLQTEQLQRWATTRKDPDDIFHLFNLQRAGESLFNKPEFATWAKYVDDFKTKHPETPMSMYSTLTKHYSNDVLLKMTESANTSERMKDIATKLESEWFQTRLNSRTTPDEALLYLGFGNARDTILESPLLKLWVRYMDSFNSMYPDKKQTIIDAFTRAFEDDGVTLILHAAKSKDATRDIATKLESAQMKMWLSSGKSTDDVLKLLKLDKEPYPNYFHDKVLINKWVAYINFFITENPGRKATILSALETRFSDRMLNRILNAASEFPSMESTALKIQTSKIQGYLLNNRSPHDVFVLLGLDDVGEKLLGTSVFHSWLEYVEIFNKRHPRQQESWIDLLLRYYLWSDVEGIITHAMQNPTTVRIGKMAVTAWHKHWLDSRRPPEEVFMGLYLDKEGEKLLASPKFETWVKYLNDFNQRYPDKKTTLIDGLRANYYDRHLVPILNAAKSDYRTKKLATDLENSLINKWLLERKKPTDLYSLLDGPGTPDELIQGYVNKLTELSKST